VKLKNDPKAKRLSRRSEVEARYRLRVEILFDTHEENGVLLWDSNGQVIPTFVFHDAGFLPPAGQAAAFDAETDRFLAEYRKRDHTPSAEEAFEMDAAFGPGKEIVNIITGKTVYRTRGA